MDHREAAEYVARRLREEHGDAVERVILYGSVARGEAGPDSDVDLLVVARDFRRVYRGLTPILAALITRGAPLVSTMVFTSGQFCEMARQGGSYYHTVQEEGGSPRCVNVTSRTRGSGSIMPKPR